MTECHIFGVEGIFHYQDGKCVREKQALLRNYTTKKKGIDCPSNMEILTFRGRRYCQDPCPSVHYRVMRGRCELRKCVVKAERMDDKGEVRCPEGTFLIPMAPM